MEVSNILLLLIASVLLLITVIGLVMRIKFYKKKHFQESHFLDRINEQNIDKNEKNDLKSQKYSENGQEDITTARQRLNTNNIDQDKSNLNQKSERSIDMFLLPMVIRNLDEEAEKENKKIDDHEMQLILSTKIQKKNKELLDETNWRLFRNNFEEELIDNNYLCCFLKSSKKKIYARDQMLLNSSLYEVCIAIVSIIVHEWTQLSDFYQILYSCLLMIPLLIIVLFSTKITKEIFLKLFPRTKSHKHDDIEEEKAINHISHAQYNLLKELKVLILFFVSFGAFMLAVSRIINLTTNEAKNVLISIGIIIGLDCLIVRNILIFIYTLIQAYCFKNNLVKLKAEEAVHLVMGNIGILNEDDKRFLSQLRRNKMGTQKQGKLRKEDFMMNDAEMSFKNDPRTFLDDEQSLFDTENFDAVPRKDSIVQDFEIERKNKKDFSTAQSSKLKQTFNENSDNEEFMNKKLESLKNKSGNIKLDKEILYGNSFAYPKGNMLGEEPSTKKRKVEGTENSSEPKYLSESFSQDNTASRIHFEYPQSYIVGASNVLQHEIILEKEKHEKEDFSDEETKMKRQKNEPEIKIQNPTDQIASGNDRALDTKKLLPEKRITASLGKMGLPPISKPKSKKTENLNSIEPKTEKQSKKSQDKKKPPLSKKLKKNPNKMNENNDDSKANPLENKKNDSSKIGTVKNSQDAIISNEYESYGLNDADIENENTHKNLCIENEMDNEEKIVPNFANPKLNNLDGYDEFEYDVEHQKSMTNNEKKDFQMNEDFNSTKIEKENTLVNDISHFQKSKDKSSVQFEPNPDSKFYANNTYSKDGEKFTKAPISLKYESSPKQEFQPSGNLISSTKLFNATHKEISEEENNISLSEFNPHKLNDEILNKITYDREREKRGEIDLDEEIKIESSQKIEVQVDQNLGEFKSDYDKEKLEDQENQLKNMENNSKDEKKEYKEKQASQETSIKPSKKKNKKSEKSKKGTKQNTEPMYDSPYSENLVKVIEKEQVDSLN